jgi:5-deoxy-glucuronate isomerase
MQRMIGKSDQIAGPVIGIDDETVSDIYFELVRLTAGESFSYALDGYESAAVVLSGKADIAVGGKRFSGIGKRRDIWSGFAEAVYAGRGAAVEISAGPEGAEIGVAGGRCEEDFEPFLVSADDGEAIEVGSAESKSKRRLQHILGKNGDGRVSRLLVSEVFVNEGYWSGYPPHKHDTDNGSEETNHQEIYHFRFQPENGFGSQLWYDGDGAKQAYMTQTGDTFAFSSGYHPNVTSPGHEQYVFAILVGKTRRSLVQNFDAEFRHLMAATPGLQQMRDRFK